LAPGGARLYAVTDGITGSGFVRAFHLGGGGKLTELSQQSLEGRMACHLVVDPEEQLVITASYGDGSISVFPTTPDGKIAAQTDAKKFEGAGPNPSRQTQPHAHFATTDPAGKFAYICDLGADKIWIFRIDPGNGTLTPADPAFAATPAGGGVRHMTFLRHAPFAYANNEMGLSVTAFSHNPETGALTTIQTLSTVPEGVTPGNWTTAAIIAHPSEKWLYVSSRGDDTISVFAIQPGGKLLRIEIAPAGVEGPRAIQVDPTGQWLLAAGQRDNRVVVQKIDPATGRLTLTDHSIEIGAPVCIVFAPAAE